jgi:type II secretory pathway pseudopilin PulG
MKRDSDRKSRQARHRRGVTLVEMLVTVAVLIIIMTVMVQIFQSATGALNAARTIQELDDGLKLLDSTIRSDLGGVTAHFTPPLDPAQGLGYFEYGENEFADLQGEDSDDYLRFTAKAPAGRPFTGRMWIGPPGAAFNNANVMPITLASEYAEIIYFLRNGNLYRRVLLVLPQELQSAIFQSPNNQFNFGNGFVFSFYPSAMGGNPVNLTGTPVSWQGVNDISAHPATTGITGPPIVPNTLGSLTNREYRYATPRFSDDFTDVTGTGGPDGLSDDLNGDNVPDYYPTLYPGVFSPLNPNQNNWQLTFEPPYLNSLPQFRIQGILGFPWIFPGAYSRAQSLPNATDKAGWIHAPAPVANVLQQPPGYAQGSAISFDSPVQMSGNFFISGPLAYLQNMNHNPLDLGDNLPTAQNPQTFVNGNGTLLNQTWWGFPTWRETLSPLWNDPTVQVNVAFGQPNGLLPQTAVEVGSGVLNVNRAMLPAMTGLWRINPQLFTDGWGDPNTNGNNFFFINTSALWGTLSWEDDLIMTNVRSFDVKAYDNSLAAYADLGWGDDFRLAQQFGDGFYGNATIAQAPYLTGNYDEFSQSYAPLASKFVNGQRVSLLNNTFAHEGRMPPLVEDFRFDYQFGAVPAGTYAASLSYNGNVGDDNPGVIRMRRIWDSWSTEYTKAPGKGVNPPNPANNLVGFPAGPPATPPVYPSYPPPYPAPLLGIQIQIRVADPTNQRVKSVTIIQDFTDKP